MATALVTAPADLEAGYSFVAEMDGMTFTGMFIRREKKEMSGVLTRTNKK
jgi:hypothetical protein